jgi:hypothetical protein
MIVVIFGALGLALLLYLVVSLYSVIFDDNVIEYKPWFAPSKVISWAEIRNIKTDMVTGTIYLLDGHSNKLMKIDKNMKNSDKFVVMLANKCPNIFVPEPNHTFRKGAIVQAAIVLFTLGISGFLIYISIRDSSTGALLFGLGIIALGIYFLVFTPNEIILQTDRLVIKSMIKTKEIMLSSIANVEYEMYMVRRGTRYFRTTLTLADGKQVPIALLGVGSLPSFLYIRSWWKQGRAQQRPEGLSR